MIKDRAKASNADAQAREALVAQLNALSKAIEKMARLLWAYPDKCNGDLARLESLGLAASSLLQASKAVGSDSRSLEEQVAMLRSLRERFETSPLSAD